ncbi:MAG: FKBP-type peptidyl-prolyl cis-trans isomerase [Bacteroidales bacterium]|nr:FKBP-type peptidyl-prolyl cis-trans isomerase [Bacteroidales bacterium]
MKARKFLFAGLIGLAAIACTSTKGVAVEGEETIESLTPSKATKDSVAYLVGVNFGSFIKNYDFGELDYAMIKKGMQDFIKAEGDARMDPDFGKQFKIDPALMNDLFNNYLSNRQKLVGLQAKADGQKFLEANAKKAGVQTTESGLQYKIIEEGTDKATSLKDTVVVRYKGTTIAGETFDEVTEDREPVSFPLEGVVKGFGEGLQLVGKGGKIQLFIPSELGYGENAVSAILKPNSTLIFDVDVIDVKHFVEKAE